MGVGPFSRFCENEVWGVHSVIATTRHTSGGGTVTSDEPTIAYAGRVVSVDEVLVTPAGTFPVVIWRTFTGPFWAPKLATKQWISIEHGVLIKQQVYSREDETIVSEIVAVTIQ